MLACNLGFFFDSICHETFISEAAESEKGCLLIYDVRMHLSILQNVAMRFWLVPLFITDQGANGLLSVYSFYPYKPVVCYVVFLVFTLIKAYGLLVFYSIQFPIPWMHGGYRNI